MTEEPKSPTALFDDCIDAVQGLTAVLEGLIGPFGALRNRIGKISELEKRAGYAEQKIAESQAQADKLDAQIAAQWKEFNELQEAHKKTMINHGQMATAMADLRRKLGMDNAA